MRKVEKSDAFVIMLAYLHRYGIPILILAVPLCFVRIKNGYLLGVGMGFVGEAVYSCVGYALKWKHIYCSWQNAHRRKMTPRQIDWNTFKKSEIYGSAVVFGIIGVVMVLVAVLYR